MILSFPVIFAEVMDKEPTALDNWKFLLLPGAIGCILILGLYLVDGNLRRQLKTGLLRLILALCANAVTVLLAGLVCEELFSVTSFQGLRAEAGDGYIIQFGLAVVTSVALPHLGHVFLRQATFVNSQSDSSKPNML